MAVAPRLGVYLGVWHDARHIAEHIVKQRLYFDYRDAAQRQADRESSIESTSLMGAR